MNHFTTSSPVNIERLSGQNRKLYDWLVAGNSIHCFHHAMREMGIGYLNSRCSDLIHKHGISIVKKWINITTESGDKVAVVEYSLPKNDCNV